MIVNEEINKIINWIDMSYTRLNYKEELLLVNYIKQLQQENARLKDKFEKAIEHIKELDDNTDDTTCYDIDKYVKEDLLNILKEN